MQSIKSLFAGFDPGLSAAMIAFLGAVISVFVSAFISLLVSRRSAYINAVTAERSKWIDKLRENIADLFGAGGALRIIPRLSSNEARIQREKLDRLIALITMQLNPKGRIDANMITLLALFPARAEDNAADYRALEAAFVRHSQFLLKEEWETVKREAMGLLAKPWWYGKRWKRRRDYKAFCRLPASLIA